MPAADEERDNLGEALYMKVSNFQPEFAGKITGMMLDSLEDSEIMALLDDEPVLREKVEQAMKVLGAPTEEKNGRTDFKAQALSLQEELQEAEKWAEDMQREWDQKEEKWTKEKAALMTRLTKAEDAAAKADKSHSNGVTAADVAKAAASEKRAQEGQRDLEKSKARVVELEAALGKAEKAAAAAAKAHAEKAPVKAAPSSGDEVALASMLKIAEERCAKAELRAKDTEVKLVEMKSKVDRCTELQQDLETANTEIKNFKAQRNGEKKDAKVADKRLADAQSEIDLLKKKLQGAAISCSRSGGGLTAAELSPAEPEVVVKTPKAEKVKNAPAPKAVSQPAPEKILVPVETPEEDDEEDEPDTPPEKGSKTMPDAKSKPTPTPSAASKSSKKKAGGATPTSASSAASTKVAKGDSFQLSGTHVVAGCLGLVVMIQLGMFVAEGWVGEQA